MEIPFQGQFDEAILRRMMWTALRPTRGRLIGSVLFACLVVWSTVVFPLTHGGSPADLSSLITVLIVVCALLFYWIFIRGPKQLQGNKLAQGSRAGTVGDQGIHLETSYSKADLPWDVFTKAKIGKDVVLLYSSSVGSSTHLFPREFFASETDWDAFVGLVRQRVPLQAAKGLRGRLWIAFLLWLAVFFVVLFVSNVFK